MASETPDESTASEQNLRLTATAVRASALLAEAIGLLESGGFKVQAAHAEFARETVLSEIARLGTKRKLAP